MHPLILLATLTVGALATAIQAGGHDPCCSFPCQNQGVCVTITSDSYTCDCSQTGFYGNRCEHATLLMQIKLWLKPDPETVNGILTRYKWFWDTVNYFPFLRETVMKKVYTLRSNMVDSPPTYTSQHEYITFEAANNLSYFTRSLPPVPRNCPTPMGVAGKKQLPDVQFLVDQLFTRTEFKPDPMKTSVLFAFFAQHFTHQFFKTDFAKGPGFTNGGHGVDVSHIYGHDKNVENLLRSFSGGKLKSQMLNGEEFPPYLRDVPGVPVRYKSTVADIHKFALGHEFFGLLPGLFLYATIWLREHNRVCEVLAKEHPVWDDERLFQTAKLIVLGETIKIVIEDYVQHLSSYNFQLLFKPDLLFGEEFQYQNRIAVEFNHLYHWHPLMPDRFNVSGKTYQMKDFMYHSGLVVEHGTHSFTDSLSRQIAGQMTYRNHGPMTLGVAADIIKHGRQLRFQGFNNYRKRFNMKPYTTFEELTGEKEIAKILEGAYGDVDAVEFYVGLLTEKRRYQALFGGTIVEMGGPFSVKGLMSNAICSPKYWKPSTFGGQTGFDIVNSASLSGLFCNNIPGQCPLVSFRIPEDSQRPPEKADYCDEDCVKKQEL
ncbi:prostaglandin G/H synthase 2-like [Liolophura sinensis]|uniref:prostaglandin G/H synthase 2-like n=1 Tax=Liolophura sinensis TaxID=3198878 RepID=UPI0031595DB2